jgi:site-specific DNA-methyltransferase (adenine-specific)
MNKIIFGDCLDALKTIESESVSATYIDPPFNTHKTQKRNRIKAISAEDGRNGFGGKKYKIENIASSSYNDSFDNFEEFLMPRIKESIRTLTPDGSIFIHLDHRESHYIKVAMDKLLGRDHFINEIIWLFDYGARSKKKWSNKHNTILWYAKDPKNYIFNYSEIDRIPYMAPGLVGKVKAARGKTVTAEWFITIVPTNSKEKCNYPTQKPQKLLERIVKMHSRPGNLIMDFFAGSGTTGMAAGNLGREFIMIDNNKPAIDIMETRLEKFAPKIIEI